MSASLPVKEVITEIKKTFPGLTNTPIGRLIRKCFTNCKRQKFSRGPYHYYGITWKTISPKEVEKP